MRTTKTRRTRCPSDCLIRSYLASFLRVHPRCAMRARLCDNRMRRRTTSTNQRWSDASKDAAARGDGRSRRHASRSARVAGTAGTPKGEVAPRRAPRAPRAPVPARLSAERSVLARPSAIAGRALRARLCGPTRRSRLALTTPCRSAVGRARGWIAGPGARAATFCRAAGGRPTSYGLSDPLGRAAARAGRREPEEAWAVHEAGERSAGPGRRGPAAFCRLRALASGAPGRPPTRAIRSPPPDHGLHGS